MAGGLLPVAEEWKVGDGLKERAAIIRLSLEEEDRSRTDMSGVAADASGVSQVLYVEESH